MKTIQDIDYLYASARIRALERSLLTREKFRQIAEAKTDEEALKVLTEAGYGELSSPSEVPEAISAKRREMFEVALSMAPEKKIVNFFLMRYDYHNIKAIVKGQAAGTDYRATLSESGTIPTRKLLNAIEGAGVGTDAELTPIMRAATVEAKDVLARTGDPRLSDTVLDRACFADMLRLAKEAESKFLEGYVQLNIDSINLRTAVRLKRMGQDSVRLGSYFIEGGTVPSARLKTDVTPELLMSIYEPTSLKAAAVAAGAAIRGEAGLSAVDVSCDNALLAYLRNAKYVAFGEQPMIAYIAACEAEFTAVHTIMVSREAGFTPEAMMERLRDTYV